MKSALILLLFSFSFLHSDGDGQDFFDISNNAEWDEGEVYIVENGNKRTRRTTTSDNFIQIQIISGDKEMEIQLEPSIVSSKLNSINFRDGEFVKSVPIDASSNCHWNGKVLGGGSASFSTCQDPNSFTGAVITEDGLWLICPTDEEYPHKSNRLQNTRVRSRSRRNGNRKERVAHLVMSPRSTASHLSNVVVASDVVRVPLEELEAAARLAAEDAFHREAQRDSENYDDPIPLAGREEPADYMPYFPSWLGLDYYNYDVEDDFITAGVPFSDHNGPRRPLLQSPVSTPLMDRKIRELENKKKWVEMAIFTDEVMYKRMEKKFPNDTLIKLKDYATTMTNMMDILYGDKSLEVDIGFRLVHLEVMKKPPKGLDSNGGKAKAYLSSFCEYAGNQNVNSGKWDHALLLTGIDLHELGVKSTAGLAWAGTMCYRYYSCSVAEGNSLGTAFIITHEIGHSLGMEHDGIGVSETCDRDKFIMSPTTGAGKVSWSNCSGKNLQDFIEYGTSELRSKKYPSELLSRPTCLSELVAKGKTSTTKPKLPGEAYDAYFQCALGLGSDFKPYFQRNKTPFNNICWILYCGNGTHAVSTHPALEGTKCDKDKYCKRGECVKRSQR